MTGLQPFDPGALVVIALLNPAVAIVGFMMGRAANQPQKLIVAAFAASLAGIILIWLGAYFKIIPARGSGTEAGLLALQTFVGLAWAALGYVLARRRK